MARLNKEEQKRLAKFDSDLEVLNAYYSSPEHAQEVAENKAKRKILADELAKRMIGATIELWEAKLYADDGKHYVIRSFLIKVTEAYSVNVVGDFSDSFTIYMKALGDDGHWYTCNQYTDERGGPTEWWYKEGGWISGKIFLAAYQYYNQQSGPRNSFDRYLSIKTGEKMPLNPEIHTICHEHDFAIPSYAQDQTCPVCSGRCGKYDIRVVEEDEWI
jgi:hypothetical protein